MNAIFTVIIIISAICLAFFSPDKFLTSMMDGAKEALLCSVSLFCIYAVWMGVSRLAEDAGLCKKVAKLFKPAIKKLFKTQNDDAAKDISMNVTCNVLGLGGAATPFAVSAINKLDADKNDFAQKLLFVLNATSIQIIPATIIALRASANSQNPSDIFLPCLIATAVCTAFSVLSFIAYYKIKGHIWRK